MTNGNIGGPDKPTAVFFVLLVLALLTALALMYIGVISF